MFPLRLYVKPPNGLPDTTQDTIWVMEKTVYGLKDNHRASYTTCWRERSCPLHQRKRQNLKSGLLNNVCSWEGITQEKLLHTLLERIQRYWKVSDEGTLRWYLGVHFTRHTNGDGLLNETRFPHSAVTTLLHPVLFYVFRFSMTDKARAKGNI